MRNFLSNMISSSSPEKTKMVSEPVKREKMSEKVNTTVPDIFPRRAKSKLIKTKPALWEISKEETKNLKNTLLKEKSESPKPMTRRNKMMTSKK